MAEHGRPDPALLLNKTLFEHTELAGTIEPSDIAEMQARVLGFLGRPYPQGTLSGTACPLRTYIFCTLKDIDTSLAPSPVILIRT